MKCKVTLKNSDYSGFSSLGEMENIGDGFSLDYKIDRDECRLTFLGGELLQERCGSVALKMRFVLGEETLCTLGEGGLSGSFPVFTEKLTVAKTAKLAEIFLVYRLGEERITLEIKAEKI